LTEIGNAFGVRERNTAIPQLSVMRWNVEGAQAMLQLRTTKLAGDWKPFVAFRIRAEQQTLYHQAA
jgi:hypothetical protein